jgi:hypothetical protein
MSCAAFAALSGSCNCAIRICVTGKTRLAIQIAGQLSGEFGDGVWYVDLAPITDPELVPVTVARALGLPDQPGRSTMDTLTRFLPIGKCGRIGQLRAPAGRQRGTGQCATRRRSEIDAVNHQP